ncbi:hypothetical protein [Nocardia sp. XZ_19_231]|uniref:hypothetical protein n=1 Tax=Nocardia sp. XZ_19_231 TaxID=2769252 RepID=UPI00188F1A72|nr:hypothetical protein [Nocardia sp. XZ_19_231]
MTDPITASTAKLREWLITGADLAEGRHQRAAVELLDFAGLLDRRGLRAHVTTRLVTDSDDRHHLIARVDWTALAAADIGPLGGTQRRLLDLALSLGGGIRVDLRLVTSAELGDAHARAVLAAVTRALGLADDVQITDTPAYLERERKRQERLAEFLGETGSAARA